MDSPHDDAVCVDAGHPEHEDGGGDEHDVETGQTNQNAVHLGSLSGLQIVIIINI